MCGFSIGSEVNVIQSSDENTRGGEPQCHGDDKEKVSSAIAATSYARLARCGSGVDMEVD